MKRPLQQKVPALLALLAISGYAFCCVVLWVEPDWRFEWDSALYILTGRALALGEGYTYLGQPFFLRPPGFAWTIALLNPDGSFEPERLNRLVMGFAALVPVCVFVSLVTRHGRWLAAVVAILAATSPATVGIFNRVLSEFPFLTFLLLGMGFLEMSARSDRTSAWWWALAASVCIAAAAYFRTVALLLIPGMLALAWRAQGRPRWCTVLSAILITGAMLPWLRYSSTAAADAEVPSSQVLNFDYATSMFRENPSDPRSDRIPLSAWQDRVQRNGVALLRDLSFVTTGQGNLWLGSMVAMVMILGLLVSVRRRGGILEWFVVSYSALLLAYFTTAFRLSVPLVPFVYLYLLVALREAARWLSARLPGPHREQVLGLAVCGGLLAVNLSHLPAALEGRGPASPERFVSLWQDPALSADIERVITWIDQSTAPEDVLLCSLAPIYAVSTGRTSYSYRFTDPRAVGSLLASVNPDYVIFEGYSPGRRALMPLVRTRTKRNWVVRRQKNRPPISAHELERSNEDPSPQFGR